MFVLSTVGLQQINLRLLKVMLRGVNDGFTAIRPGHQTTGNAWYDQMSFKLFLTSGRDFVWRYPVWNVWFQQRNMTRGEVLWRFGKQHRSILLVPFLPFMVELMQGCTAGCVTRCINDPDKTQFSKMTMQKGFSHGLKSMKVDIFPCWQAHSSHLNITKPLLWFLETAARNRFPHPTYLKQLSRRMV
jgi:hypothetical protein